MIYRVSGKLVSVADRFAVVETGGVGFKVFISARTQTGLGAPGADVSFFTHMHVREDGIDLFGFLSEGELVFFELLISVSGVGPRSALSILDVASLEELSAAIKEGRPDLLSRASGIGKKTAEKIIIELKTKVQSVKAGVVVQKMEVDEDLIEALANLGYRRDDAREALAKVGADVQGINDRLRAALGILGKRGK
jgi:Holliday junction DNA helicase RuvA